MSTTLASDGMEAARRACGGHGYSLLSGLPTLFTHYVQNVTWEGDNNVMLLQVTPAASLLRPAWLCAFGCLMCVSLVFPTLPLDEAGASFLVAATSSNVPNMHSLQDMKHT